MNKVYEYVTDEICRQLEQGTIPWRKPWQGGEAINYVTRKPYRGINRLLLPGGEFLTFKQVQALKGHIKKGAKSYMVTFWKKFDNSKENDDGKIEINNKPGFMLRYYRVFSLNDVEGIDTKLTVQEFEFTPIQECENIVVNYKDCPVVKHEEPQAYYSPSMDHINMPDKKLFENEQEYYSTLFHEMIHSTGHASRLNRHSEQKNAAFGSKDYSKEELVAEIGAAMLCGVSRIENSTLENSAAYIQAWLTKLRDDKSLIMTAAGKAQKASDYIQQ